MEETGSGLELPGFRFHPTEEELLGFYLNNLVFGKKMHLDIIGFLNIYRHDPWDLPGLAKIGEREWYFYVPRDRKPSNGGRPNRTTQHGFWKATGSDRKVIRSSDPKRVIGLRKTLVFYEGKAPRGSKTDWIMNEFRLPDTHPSPHTDIVLCKIYRKATSMKELEERAAKEEAAEKSKISSSSYYSHPTSPISSTSNWNAPYLSGGFVDHWQDPIPPNPTSTNHNINNNHIMVSNINKEEAAVDHEEKFDLASNNNNNNNILQLPMGKENLGQLQVPKFTMDWAQDALCSSPWLASLLNFTSPTLLSPFLST